MSTDLTHPKIAIVGGGLAGLSLLLTLHRRGVQATLYERDPSFSARAHLGGSLDLGWKSGQRALRENGLQDEFTKNSRPEGEELKMYDAAGKLHLHHGIDDNPGADAARDPTRIRPEIDRTILRKIFLDACPPDSIKWDHSVASVRALGDGQHELTFTNGLKDVCDLLVGADGAYSRIRPLVSPATPFYTGFNGAEISLAPSVASSPELADVVATVGQGTMSVLTDSKMLGSQPNGDGRIRTYAFFRESADWALPSNPDEARKVLLAKYEGWAPWMLKLIEHCDDAAIYPRPLYILPVGHSWEHVSGVTLIGDAAHLMSPFAGAGANLAMLDGLELGLVLAQLAGEGKLGDPGAREAAIKACEDKTCALAGRVAAKSMKNMEIFVGPNTPQAALDRFQEMAKEGEREG
ncbi:monooxygenase [Daedaleopsis nitida]|nr:monooxygenase [Daedaleopsis nitida]